MRKSSRSFLVVSTLAAAAAGLAAGAVRTTAAEEEDEDAVQIPYRFDVFGTVQSGDGSTFAVDGVQVVIPFGSTPVTWDPSRVEVFVDPAAVVPGGLVHVVGALRGDGRLVAQTVEAVADAGAPVRYVSGIIDAMGPSSITVGGETFHVEITPACPKGFSLGQEQDLGVAFAELRRGDAVVFAVADAGIESAVVHPTGEGSTLTGVITDAGAPGELFGGEGVGFAVDGIPAFAFEATAGWLGDRDRTGESVRLTGRFHDGRIVVERLRALPRGSARRPGRVELSGVVTDVGRDSIAVNGLSLAVEVPPAPRRALRASAAAASIGEWIVVKGRTTRAGAVQARKITRR